MTRILTPHEAAGRLRISTRALGQLISARQIPFIVLPGGDVRFDETGLSQWIDSLRTAPESVTRFLDAERVRPDDVQVRPAPEITTRVG